MSVKTDKIFVIHYTKLKERKTAMDLQLMTTGSAYEYIESFDREDLNEEIINKFHRRDKAEHDKKISPLWDVNVHSFRDLTKPEISCAMKHFEALRRISQQCENHGLILEDDALLSSNFNNGFNECVENLPNDWDVALIGSGCGEWFIKEKIQDAVPVFYNKRIAIFKMPHPSTNCAEAYLVKKEAAEKIYQSVIPFDLAGDWELAYQFFKLALNVYWLVPPIVHQGSKNGRYESSLDEGRVIR